MALSAAKRQDNTPSHEMRRTPYGVRRFLLSLNIRHICRWPGRAMDSPKQLTFYDDYSHFDIGHLPRFFRRKKIILYSPPVLVKNTNFIP
jgi:hypothetical protein